MQQYLVDPIPKIYRAAIVDFMPAVAYDTLSLKGHQVSFAIPRSTSMVTHFQWICVSYISL
jgi:hypothetical protein